MLVYDDDEELWTGVLGKHGIGASTLASEDLIHFCEINFYKKYYGTWTNPGTTVCHMINFVIMRTR